jgi:glycosyltransferase involved in cell wall biosynthesis
MGMRVGFDAKRLFFNDTGLGVYSRLLLEGLQTHYPEPDYMLFAKKATQSKYYHQFSDLPIISSEKMLWRTWRMGHEIENNGCDIYHGLTHEIPIGLGKKNVRSVVTIHDLIFKKDPQLFPLIDRLIYDWKWDYSCRHADRIVAVSRHTKSDIIEIYQIPEEKIEVIHPPIDLQFGMNTDQQKLDDNRQKYHLPSAFFLYVSSINQRKNLLGLVKAISLLDHKDRMPLVVVGKGGSYEQKVRAEINRLDLQETIYFVGHVSNDELPAFYAAALALVYPSIYEGFGIPIVESLLCDTPVITSNLSSMPEAMGPGGILIDPYAPEQIADAMLLMCSRPDLRKEYAMKGHAYVQQFGIQKACQKVMQLYQQLMEG